MNEDEHQRERMRAWITFRLSQLNGYGLSAHDADERLAEFDKRFPAPAAVDTDRERRENLHCVISDLTDQCREANTELATLREKARMWDAVADGAINLSYYESAGFQASWPAPAANGGTARCGSGSKHTAAEAVEAAIAAGALK